MDTFAKIEKCASLWKSLETAKSWYQDYPELQAALEGAIIKLRLEIIILCQSYLEETK